MPTFKCSYAADIACYADFTLEANSEAEAQAKLEEMLKRGCFTDVPVDPCWENGTTNERVFVSGEDQQDYQPLAELEGFKPDAQPEPLKLTEVGRT